MHTSFYLGGVLFFFLSWCGIEKQQEMQITAGNAKASVGSGSNRRSMKNKKAKSSGTIPST
jgi:hypothetical protein